MDAHAVADGGKGGRAGHDEVAALGIDAVRVCGAEVVFVIAAARERLAAFHADGGVRPDDLRRHRAARRIRGRDLRRCAIHHVVIAVDDRVAGAVCIIVVIIIADGVAVIEVARGGVAQRLRVGDVADAVHEEGVALDIRVIALRRALKRPVGKIHIAVDAAIRCVRRDDGHIGGRRRITGLAQVGR